MVVFLFLLFVLLLCFLVGVLLYDAVEGLEAALSHNKHLSGGYILEADVVEVGVDNAGQIGGQGPGGGGPANEGDLWLLQEGESDVDGGVEDILEVETSLEVRKTGIAAIGVGHNFAASIDMTLIVDLLEDPPDRLHEGRVQSLVVILEINPTTSPGHNLLPGGGVPHNNLPALRVVVSKPKLLALGLGIDFELLVDLKLDRESVAVPPELTGHVVPGHGGISGDHVLDGTCTDVAVVGEPCGEGGPVVEGVRLLALRLLELLLEGVNLLPVCQYVFL